MTAPTVDAATTLPSAVPDLRDTADSGRWRDVGVTHWHLLLEDIGIGDRDRFTADRWHRLNEATTTCVTDPREALDWIARQRMAAIHRSSRPEQTARRAGMGTPDDWQARHAITWWMLTHAAGVAGGAVAVSETRVVEIYADPHSARTCARH